MDRIQLLLEIVTKQLDAMPNEDRKTFMDSLPYCGECGAELFEGGCKCRTDQDY